MTIKLRLRTSVTGGSWFESIIKEEPNVISKILNERGEKDCCGYIVCNIADMPVSILDEILRRPEIIFLICRSGRLFFLDERSRS
jgi:hypothetical protein